MVCIIYLFFLERVVIGFDYRILITSDFRFEHGVRMYAR